MFLHHIHSQGCHLYGAQSGTSEESAAASETEHVRRLSNVGTFTRHQWSVTPHVSSGSNRSLIDQLKKLQAVVKISTMKTSTTSTCVMVHLPFSAEPAKPFVSISCCSLASPLSSFLLSTRYSCSRSVSSFSHQSIRLPETRSRRKSTLPLPVSWPQIESPSVKMFVSPISRRFLL